MLAACLFPGDVHRTSAQDGGSMLPSPAESNKHAVGGKHCRVWTILWHTQTRRECCWLCQGCVFTDKQCWLGTFTDLREPTDLTQAYLAGEASSMSWFISKQNWQDVCNSTQLVSVSDPVHSTSSLESENIKKQIAKFFFLLAFTLLTQWIKSHVNTDLILTTLVKVTYYQALNRSLAFWSFPLPCLQVYRPCADLS